MKQYSFSFNPELLEEFKKVLPTNRSKKILKNYLLKEYELPESLDELLQPINNAKIQPYWMTDEEITKIDRLIKHAQIKGLSVNRSSIMRNVMKHLVDIYKNKPIKKSPQHAQKFRVSNGTKKRLATLIDNGELTYELSSFILDGYIPSNDFPTIRNQEQEDLHFKSDIEVFEKLDNIANEYGFKKGGRAKIFRDALSQFELLLQSNPPKKAALRKELKSILDEYKNLEDIPVIQEEISKYLKD